MKGKVFRAVNRLLNRLGIGLVRVQRFGFRTASRFGDRLYVGCGHDRRPGYLGCDLRETPVVDLVCRAWEVSRHLCNLQEIYSRHMLEHLTYAEVVSTLADWHDALRLNGRVHIVVPNLDFHIEQWQRAEWTTDAFDDKRSNAAWSIAGFYGWQQECDPRAGNYNCHYWDVHKSGYNAGLLRFYLEQAGFSDVTTMIVDGCHIVAYATKKLDKFERQVGPSLQHIRADHRARYEFAARRIADGAEVLDIACGVGYGSSIIARHAPNCRLLAIDVETEAIRYAKRHYSSDNIEFVAADALHFDFRDKLFDVVISFETLEHLDAVSFLDRLNAVLAADGLLLCSTPNESVLPFDPQVFPYHRRHYTPQEFEQLLNDAGFRVLDKFSQPDGNDERIIAGWSGKYNIAVCSKSAYQQMLSTNRAKAMTAGE